MASPPTDRVLDIIELLSRPAHGPMRLVDVARQLDITQSTAHAIVTTMCARGWLSRDPIDRTITLGPALGLAAARADIARPRAHAARTAALELADELGFAASVTERSDTTILVTFFGGGPTHVTSPPAGEGIPFAAPFGSAFAAWDPEPERQAWVRRGSASNDDLRVRLEEFLAATRARGYSIERMSPSLARAAQVMQSLDEDPWSQSVRRTVDEALAELAANGLDHGDDADPQPVTAISAPIFDAHRRVVLNLAIHPFTLLRDNRIATIGAHLTRAAGTISAAA